MTRLSAYAKQRILTLRSLTLRIREIMDDLENEGLKYCRNTIEKFLKKYDYFESLINQKPPGRRRILSYEDELKLIAMLDDNDELALDDMRGRFDNRVSKSTIQRILSRHEYRSIKTRYCQNVKKINQHKRHAYGLLLTYFCENFDNMIFTDESTIKLEIFASRKWASKYDKKKYAKYKHPLSVRIKFCLKLVVCQLF